MRLLFVLIIILSFSTVHTRAQSVKPVTVEQLEQRFSQGKDTVYVVNFWATWCGPCVAELPYFERLQTERRAQPVKVLLVSMDFPSQLKHAVVPFVKKKKLLAEVVLASRKSEQDFINSIDKDWSGSIPATLVVKPSENIRKFYERSFSYAELNSLLPTP